MLTRTLRTIALAAAVVIASAGASMAATYAWVDHDAAVKKNPGHIGPAINWVEEGQKVKIIGQKKNYFKVQIPGQDGWVHANALDWAPTFVDYPYGGYPYGGPGGSFCANGTNASFCFSVGY